MHHFILNQIEQEMDLIFGKPERKAHFILQWTTKYVPAVLEYASKSNKKYLSSILETLKEEGSSCTNVYLYGLNK